MSSFSELIKNFHKTRDYVRDFFIYGFKVRNDFSLKSSRTYDDEKRRVESWLGDFLSYGYSDRGRQVSISLDSSRITENPLYKAYYSKSFTDNDIKLHFLLSDILSYNKSLSLKEIITALDNNYGTIFEEQTVRNKLKEYVREGLFVSEKRGKTDYFSLSPDTAQSFFGEYEGLDDAVSFFSEMQEFGVIGNSLLKTADIKNEYFSMKHNYIVHTLEDIILMDILKAIEEKRYISFTNFSTKPTARPAEFTDVIPVSIFVSVQSGRRYLVSYFPQFERFNSSRLDFIKNVKTGNVCEYFDEITEELKNKAEKCFGVSFGNKDDDKNVQEIKITFHIDEEKEAFVVNRLMREKRSGIIEKTGENLYTFKAEVIDPNELTTWLKTFMGRVISVEGGTDEFREKFKDDVNKMYRLYGGESD